MASLKLHHRVRFWRLGSGALDGEQRESETQDQECRPDVKETLCRTHVVLP